MTCCLPLEQAVLGIRFQPIYSLIDRQIEAWEILSILHPDLNHEHYFASQPDDVYMSLLYWQLHIIAKMKNKRRYYFNIPAKMLCSEQVVERIAVYLRQGIVIEIQDPYGLIQLSPEERKRLYQNIERIRSRGAEVWLDDILPEQITYLTDEINLFNGVKIDKSLLLSNTYGEDSLQGLISHCLARVKLVLVEGIENIRHFKLAEGTGCHYLQGFMWPEQKFKLRYTAVSDD